MPEDFSQKLNAILADPDAMGKILSLAQSLEEGTEAAIGTVVDVQFSNMVEDGSVDIAD